MGGLFIRQGGRLLRGGGDTAMFGHEMADGARGLTQALGVFHQPDPHEALAMLAKAKAGGHGNPGLFQQQLGKTDTAQFTEPLRDRRPREHGPVG